MNLNSCHHMGFSQVDHCIGKVEVHSSILCGSTSDLRPINAACKHEISDRPGVADLTQPRT